MSRDFCGMRMINRRDILPSNRGGSQWVTVAGTERASHKVIHSGALLKFLSNEQKNNWNGLLYLV